MTWFQSVIIAIVEGLTEFLPISSTGHMIIAQHLLGVPQNEFAKAFTVIIQLGAILSVIVLYYKRFINIKPLKVFALSNEEKTLSVSKKLGIYFSNFTEKYDFYWKLLIAFIPAAILGFLFSDKIDELLESVMVVGIMLIIGGVFMIFADRIFSKTTKDQAMTRRRAFIIGLCQCIAMIPGVSRSMATIVGGMSQKLTRKNAAEFSFFLAVPTMAAAAGYKMLKLLIDPASRSLLMDNIGALIIGNVVAFIVAMLAIKFFISFLAKYGFKAFGYYRIIVGSIMLILLLTGSNMIV